MAVKVNRDALEHAEKLIKAGKIERDSDWSEAQPSTQEENAFIEQHGWEAFARWHLAYDPEENEETKGRHKFPFGDFRKVQQSALIAIKQRAGSEDYDDVQAAADELLRHLSVDH